ncbi:formate/nitrite transporter family protein [Paramuribaculum intestinale]|uniref:formate/nitrite transporter family protein n=2 Tax=Paramuribaculum intestinale TaxID=2094151 RepID=UPI0025B0D7F0|nr:formate/nitrite transporter family protein [Paramuribaculum intestinale]
MDLRTPPEVIEATLKVAEAKVATGRSLPRLMTLSVLAGAYIALGGVLSVIVGYGFPGLTEANPALQRVLSGAMFPVGLILVVVLGAELFTGNNALLIPAFMSRRCTAGEVARNWTLVYLGNFVGALLFTWLMVYAVGLTAADPWHSAVQRIAVAKVSMPWLTVFVKGVGANWCVCLAVWLALSGRTLLSKMAGCWLPVMAFVALGYEHSIANMFFIPLGMMEGAPVGVGEAVTANLIPATLGNIAGGALLVGCVHAALHLQRKPEGKKS